jgi:predicted DsbA family dithiol-disulfide isomerase
MAQELVREVDSYPAQRVAWRAAREGVDGFESFHRAVFDALWEEGRDVGDAAVLTELASEAGFPDGFVDGTLADGESADELEAAFLAAKRERITGVPTFVAGDHAARGAVPPEQLRRLVEGA